MSSTNKTSLGLNMWEASDKPVRQDFVNDNFIIDEKITKLNSNLYNFNYTYLNQAVATEYVSLLITDINNYKEIAVAMINPSNAILTLTRIPVALFKTLNTPSKVLSCSYAGVSSNYQASCYYINDTHISVITSNANNACRIYGIK
ncbi:MAG: hypothetical protein LBQ71_01715 [Hungatella sp.]|jgi:hypothetical protein|nr:hypothetical protein [Hungatella sp.]